MQKILSKFKRHDRGDVSEETPDENITIQQVFHYRKQKGVNLGTFCFRPSCQLPILNNVSHQVPGLFLNVGLLTALSNTPFNPHKATLT